MTVPGGYPHDYAGLQGGAQSSQSGYGPPPTPHTASGWGESQVAPAPIAHAATGMGAPMQMPMVAQAMLLGGNVRVGLEDNIWLDKGVHA